MSKILHSTHISHLCSIAALVLFLVFDIATLSYGQRLSQRNANSDYLKSAEARRIGEQMIAYQRVTGGWPKNIDMARKMSDEELTQVLRDKKRRDDSTIDNGATTQQITFLAQLYQATGDKQYRDAVRRGVEYLLSGQYDNGGWPQFWPDADGYHVQITFNDDAIINTLSIIQKMVNGESPFTGDIIDSKLKGKMQTAIAKGIDCILRTQIVVDGKPTVWCQQHDRKTLLPCKARSYELPSFCSQESARIVAFLMAQPNPDERMKRAIHGAMGWFDKYKLTGVRYHHGGFRGENDPTRLIADAQAQPLWARFYDLERCEPYVSDRDGVPRKSLSEIGSERRNGYSWFGERPRTLYSAYAKWADEHDPANKLDISLGTKGANENGTFILHGVGKK